MLWQSCLPWHSCCRWRQGIFVAAIDDKKLTAKDVATIADIPEHYVAMALSPGWPETHERLLGL
jgi:hypothetical protein